MLNIRYETILNRQSTRRYEKKLLPEKVLNGLSHLKDFIVGLDSESLFEYQMQQSLDGTSLQEVSGFYGAFLNPPHFIVPHMIGKGYLLTDLGFRMQQVVLWLEEQQIGSCYMGCLGYEERVKDQFNLPENSVIGSLLVFGYPSNGLVGKQTNPFIRKIAGSINRLPFEKTFYLNDFDHPGNPPEQILSILEAARLAPSAVNAQPWRFLLNNNVLYLFVTRNNPKYGSGKYESYCFYDGGIAMANVLLACPEIGLEARWDLCLEIPQDLLGMQIPDNLQLLGMLKLGK